MSTNPSASTRSASSPPFAYPAAIEGGRTSSRPTPSGAASAPASSSTLIATPGCGRPIAPIFSGCSFASAAVQPITSPISACPYPLSTVTPNLSVKRRAWIGDSGAVMLRT